jgi:hypothetical protein
MRIPTSMIVMGVITAVPFGLAIRQTLHKGADADRELEEALDPSLKYERESAARQAEIELTVEREREREAKEKQATRVVQRTVFGTSPATLGTLFTGIELGTVADDHHAEQIRGAASDHHIHIDFEHDVKQLVGVAVELGGYERECDDFVEDLRAAWGPSTSGDADHGVWFGPGRRAQLDVAECKLFIERTVDVATWIGHGDAIVPLDYVGKPVKALVAKLGPTVDADETMMAWQQVGVGNGGSGLTTLTAELANGKIVALTASANVDMATRAEVEDRLTKLYGTPKEAPESGASLRWTGRPPVELSITSRGLELRAGK